MVLDEAGFIQRVGVDGDLDVELVGDAEAAVDGGWSGAPILVELQADGAGEDLLAQRRGRGAVAFAEKAAVHRVFVGRFQHAVDIPDARRASSGVSAVRGAGAAADHGGDATGERVLDLLRADEVDVRVDAARGDDAAFARDDFRRRADGHAGRDALLDAGISRVADGGDAPAFDADVGFDDALHGVEDERVCDDEIERLGVRRRGRLAHAVANHFAAAEFHLVADRAGLGDKVALDFDEQLRVREAHAVAHGGPEHLGVLAAAESERHGYAWVSSSSAWCASSQAAQRMRPVSDPG
jgi:hypothetical protein